METCALLAVRLNFAHKSAYLKYDDIQNEVATIHRSQDVLEGLFYM
jgi:hypothetical protein